jgi:DNA-binding NarL/FixJ family response regulator
MINDSTSKPILVCDTQPVAIEGIRGLLDNSGDLSFAGSVGDLEALLELTRAVSPAAVLLDKGLGLIPVMEWLHGLGTSGLSTAPVVWGTAITEAEALRFLQAGARGIIRRTAQPETVMTCLRSVTSGVTWMEEGIFGATTEKLKQPRRSQLTAREQQVTELVERGLRNRDIGRQLGIQTGTVKIHLKHIFEKTGVRGRYGLALTGLREKGTFAPVAVPEVTAKAAYF